MKQRSADSSWFEKLIIGTVSSSTGVCFLFSNADSFLFLTSAKGKVSFWLQGFCDKTGYEALGSGCVFSCNDWLIFNCSEARRRSLSLCSSRLEIEDSLYGGEGCPIHPNWFDSTKLIHEPSQQKSVRDVQSTYLQEAVKLQLSTIWLQSAWFVWLVVDPSNVMSIYETIRKTIVIKQTEGVEMLTNRLDWTRIDTIRLPCNWPI